MTTSPCLLIALNTSGALRDQREVNHTDRISKLHSPYLRYQPFTNGRNSIKKDETAGGLSLGFRAAQDMDCVLLTDQ